MLLVVFSTYHIFMSTKTFKALFHVVNIDNSLAGCNIEVHNFNQNLLINEKNSDLQSVGQMLHALYL